MADLIPVLVFLSGSRRGATIRLSGDKITVGSDPTRDVPLPPDTEPLPLPLHATLERRGQSYEVVAAPGAELWINGEPEDRLVLASGDVLELGRDGAVLRYRLYEERRLPYKTVPEIFSDCLECVRAERGVLAKAEALATVLPRELATRSTRTFRALTVLTLIAIAAATSITARRGTRLEARLLSEVERIEGISSLVSRAAESRVDNHELMEVVTALRATDERVNALEARNSATARVIGEAGRATLFLQGSYQFMQPGSERPLRLVLGSDGRPIRNPLGYPALSLDGDGPPLEVFVTGTGFVVTANGRAITNRHVAFPWEFDDAARNILLSGFEARWTRFVGFLSDGSAGHDIENVLASHEVDLAVIQLDDAGESLPFLEPSSEPPAPGDPIVVMGYPLGLRALMARSDAVFVDGLRQEGVTDFFEQAERIATAGFMRPLATRGIVGQVTGASVVYDAETTSGGSGGPVLSLDGRVVAVNTAILPEFGGSNLGVPAEAIHRLLERAASESRRQR